MWGVHEQKRLNTAGIYRISFHTQNYVMASIFSLAYCSFQYIFFLPQFAVAQKEIEDISATQTCFLNVISSFARFRNNSLRFSQLLSTYKLNLT
jgi:ABC-type uncharacterized transport system fused permease/ATPase subunit